MKRQEGRPLTPRFIHGAGAAPPPRPAGIAHAEPPYAARLPPQVPCRVQPAGKLKAGVPTCSSSLRWYRFPVAYESSDCKHPGQYSRLRIRCATTGWSSPTHYIMTRLRSEPARRSSPASTRRCRGPPDTGRCESSIEMDSSGSTRTRSQRGSLLPAGGTTPITMANGTPPPPIYIPGPTPAVDLQRKVSLIRRRRTSTSRANRSAPTGRGWIGPEPHGNNPLNSGSSRPFP